MASRTVYTSTITVPVYASWKCEECGEVNFATGAIVVKRQESSSSWRPSKQREAEAKAASLAQAEWAGETLQIISDPNNHAQDMRNGLFLENTHCTKCGKKPKWDKDMKYLTAFISEPRYKKMMKNLPKKYTPVMGSLNPELIEYAEALGKKIPNLDECIATVKGYDQVATSATPKVQPVVESTAPENTTTVQSNFCRKCGAQLQADSGFCHKCGTEIVK